MSGNLLCHSHESIFESLCTKYAARSVDKQLNQVRMHHAGETPFDSRVVSSADIKANPDPTPTLGYQPLTSSQAVLALDDLGVPRSSVHLNTAMLERRKPLTLTTPSAAAGISAPLASLSGGGSSANADTNGGDDSSARPKIYQPSYLKKEG